MKLLFKILFFLLIGVSVKAQSKLPIGLPSPHSTNWYEVGYIQADSASIPAYRDTSFAPRFQGTTVLWLHSGVDSVEWWFIGNKWIKKNSGGTGGTGLNQLTGDVLAGPGTGSQPATLATVNTNTGSFGDASHAVQITLNGKGLSTAAGSIAIQIPESQVTNLVTDLAGKQPNITIGSTSQYFRGDLSLATFPTNLSSFTNGPGYITTISGITAGGALAGTYPNPTLASVIAGGSCTNCNLTYNAAGQLTVAGNGASGGLATASGDATGTVSGTNLPLTLATVNSNVGTFGNATSVAQLTTNAKGLTTAASSVAIQIAESQVTNLVTDLAGKQATGNYVTAGTGDVVFTGPGSVPATIQANAVTTSKIINSAVTLPKLANGTAFSLIGYDASGVPIGYTAGTNITISGGTISATSGGGGITQLFAKAPIQILGTDTVKADTTTAGTGLATLYQESLKLIKPTFLGNLYVVNSWAGTTDFTLVGTPTFAASGGKLTLSGGTQQPSATVGTNNTAFNQVVKNTLYGGTMLERWKYSDSIVINNTPGTTTYGIGIGQYSTASALSNCIGYFNASTNTGTGTVSLLLGASNTTAAISPNAITFSSGDTIILSVERVQDRVTVSAVNIHTKSSIVTASYTWDQSSASNILSPNTGNFSTINFGGSYIINSMNISSNEVLGANLLMGGDSKFAGYDTYWDHRIGSLLNRYLPATIVCAGEGDRTQDLINHLHEIIALKPQKVLLCIGRNDLAGGVATATWQANLDTIANRLTAASIPYYTLDAIYETAQSQTALINSIDTMLVFSGKVIQTYTPTNIQNSVNTTDNIHPTWIGTEAAVDAIRNYFILNNQGQFLNDRFPIRTQTPSYDSIRVYGTINMNKWTSNNLFFEPSQARQSGDLIMCAGCAITGAYGLPTQANRFITVNNSNAGMDFRTYTGGNLTNNIINFYTSGGTTGSQVLNLAVTQGGATTTGAATGVNTTASLNRGDVVIPANAAFKSGTANDGLHENQIILDTAANGNTMFRNYGALGSYLFFQAKNTAGSQTQTMTLAPRGGLLLGGTTEDSLAILNMTSTTKGFYPTRLTLAQANALPSLGASIGLGLHSVITDSASKLGYWNGTKWIMYATTDQLGGGGAVSSVTATNTTLTISPTTGSVLAGLNLANANTWTGKQTQPAPIFTGTTSAGANDSVVTIDPASGQVHWRSGTKTINFVSGLNAPTTDSVYLGGTLLQPTNIAIAGFKFGFTGVPSGTGNALIQGADSAMRQMKLASGSYTPTLTNTTNITSSSLNTAVYTVIGNIVHVVITGALAPTVISTQSTLTFSLPPSLTPGNTGITVGLGNVAPNGGGLVYVSGLVAIASSSTGTFNFFAGAATTSSNFAVTFDYSL